MLKSEQLDRQMARDRPLLSKPIKASIETKKLELSLSERNFEVPDERPTDALFLPIEQSVNKVSLILTSPQEGPVHNSYTVAKDFLRKHSAELPELLKSEL
jgi:hypothetical protein